MNLHIPRYEGPDIVGLPADGRFIPVTNSEFGRLDCLRKHFFGYVERLQQPETRAMSIGNAWDLVMGDVFDWWRVHDTPYKEGNLEQCPWCTTFETGERCEHCHGSGEGVMVWALERWQDSVDAGDMEPDEFDRLRELLTRMATGYIVRYQGGPLQSITIEAVQQGLARVVLNPATGEPYCPDTFIRADGNGWVIARTGDMVREGVEVSKVNWPIYQVGRMDVLGADRRTRAAWVIDSKSSGQPSGFAAKLSVDPQLPGYCWLLEPHLERFGLNGIAGYYYDITSTTLQRDPKELAWKPPKIAELREMAKERGIESPGRKVEDFLAALGIEPQHGGFSLARSGENASVPSWRYLAALDAAGIPEDEYDDHLDWCVAEVDPKFYKREWEFFGETALNRYAREVFAKSRQWAQQYRNAARAKDEGDLDVAFPRTPICTIGNRGCAFKGICSQDSDEGRSGYDMNRGLRWESAEEPVKNANLDFGW